MTFGLPQRLLAAGAVCLVALIALVVIEDRARAAGSEVIVAMEPVDPRSILSGHYVMLGFTEALPAGEACPPLTTNPGDDGWIALKRRGDLHTAAASAPTRAEVEGKGEVLVRGWAMCDEPVPAATDPEPAPGAPGRITMHLGVERFHADQDEATAIEKAMRDRPDGDFGEQSRVAAILSIGADGKPRTKGLVVDGKRVELTWF